jgi:hypothetical protein
VRIFFRRMRGEPRKRLAILAGEGYVGSRRGTEPPKSEAIEV